MKALVTAPIRVCHVASGDIWGGAEAQLVSMVSYMVLQPQLKVFAIILNHGRLADEISRYGVTVKVLDETSKGSFQLWLQLVKCLKEWKVDIIHTHRYKENVLGGIAARVVGFVHVVRSVHGLPEPFSGFKRLKIEFYGFLNHLTGRFLTDKIIAVSADIKQILDLRYKNGKVINIPNAANLTEMVPKVDVEIKRKDLDIGVHSKIIGAIGRLTPIKGMEYFLRGARIISAARSDVNFIVVGDGPERENLKSLANALKIECQMIFLGDRDDVVDLINLMDVIVLPSIHEGIPTVLLEALALGKPVVATRVGGVPEVLNDEDLGILIESKNPIQMANACLRLLGSSNSVTVRKRRRQYIETNFSSEVIGRKVLAAYQVLMAKDFPTT